MYARGQFSAAVKVAQSPLVERFIVGRPAIEAAELLPRVFNLCRASQEVAARLAFGLPPKEGWKTDLCRDIAREHALKLGVVLPLKMGLEPLTLPAQNARLGDLLLGPSFPKTGQAFETYLNSCFRLAPLLRKIDQSFAQGEGISRYLPGPMASTIFNREPMENSVASRHSDHPVLAHIEATRGRGPLWRLVARGVDLLAVERGILPAVRYVGGCILVPAARGIYAVRAKLENDRVTEFERITPTDHLLLSGGILEQSLQSLPKSKAHLAPVLLDILDPCVPVELEGEWHNA